mgnify:FL=1|tara:strand:+ start:264 stop:545 length:282 start_codon:yes stop_codon:yes gene_type:complete
MIRLIDITDDDINNGVQCDNHKCAIARALKREYKTDDVHVMVEDDYPNLIVNKKELRYNYENDVLDFIDCYDNMSTEDDYYLTPKPFTLEVVE